MANELAVHLFVRPDHGRSWTSVTDFGVSYRFQVHIEPLFFVDRTEVLPEINKGLPLPKAKIDASYLNPLVSNHPMKRMKCFT